MASTKELGPLVRRRNVPLISHLDTPALEAQLLKDIFAYCCRQECVPPYRELEQLFPLLGDVERHHKGHGLRIWQMVLTGIAEMEAAYPPATSNCSPAGGVATSHPCTLPLSQERLQDSEAERMDAYDVADDTTVGHYLLRAAHDGRLSVHTGVHALRMALLGSLYGQHTLAVAEREPLDVLDHLSDEWGAEVVALRSQADCHGMRMMKTREHLAELASYGDAARAQWMGILGVLDTILAFHDIVPEARDQHCESGFPGCPLLHKSELHPFLAVFRGLMPKPQCVGSFDRSYPPYNSSWAVCDDAEAPPPVGLRDGTTSKVRTLQGHVVELCMKAARQAVHQRVTPATLAIAL